MPRTAPIESMSNDEILKELYGDNYELVQPHELYESDFEDKSDIELAGIFGKYPASIFNGTGDMYEMLDLLEDIGLKDNIITSTLGTRDICQVVIITDEGLVAFEKEIKKRLLDKRSDEISRFSIFSTLSRKRTEIEEIADTFGFSSQMVVFIEKNRVDSPPDGDPMTVHDRELTIHTRSQIDAQTIERNIRSKLESENKKSYGHSISSKNPIRADSSKPSVHIKYEAIQDLRKAVWEYKNPLKSGPTPSS